MGKFMKNGKVVLVLGGRFAGRKAVIVKVSIAVDNFFVLVMICFILRITMMELLTSSIVMH